jgi:heme oxygenase
MSATDRLREDTRALHERVEAATDLERRRSSLTSYRELLARTAAYLRAVEPRLDAWCGDDESRYAAALHGATKTFEDFGRALQAAA